MARKPKPFDQIMKVRTTLGLFVQYGEPALQGQPIAEFMADAHQCFEHLMDFRNIINGMVSFDQPPVEAVLPYLPSSDE